jgi:cellulose synthase/poly-beta-1,6-N-acetylglucosamine synthase-like glycosyltransferase
MILEQLLFISFISVSSVMALYYLVFLRFALAPNKDVKPANFPVSVIVVGRNEAENFRKNLPELCKQNYSDFEVVAVNDQSLDDSKDVIEELQKEFPNLKLVDVAINERFWLGKKYGLTLGIKAASHDQLLLTDADCIPNSPHWISEMVSSFSSKKTLVLGYGKYELQNSLVNYFIQFETVHTAIQYFSWALVGLPYMGVGRNLAYNRQLFFEKKGFVSHMHIPSGDDDMFVQEAGTRKNTAVAFHKESHTVSEPKKTFGEWIKQKQRHYKTSKYYKPGHKFVLGLYGIMQPLFYVLLVLALVFTPYWEMILIATGAKVLLQYLVFIFSTLKLGSYRILWVLPLLEILTWCFQLYALSMSKVNKKQRW